MEERKEHFSRPTSQRPPSLLNLTLVAVLLGFISGLGAYILAQNILPAAESKYPNLIDWTKNNNVNVDQVFSEQAKKSQDSVAGIYRMAAKNSVLGQPLFALEDFLGSAVVVTSDGWLMTTNQVVKNNQVYVVLGDKLYSVEDLRRDDFDSVVFIKIAANFLSPVDFQLTDQIKTGESLYSSVDAVHGQEHNLYINNLSDAHYEVEKYLSTDSIDYYLQMPDIALPDQLSAPYFNIEGNLIGLSYNLNGDLVLLPGEYLKQSIKNLLNSSSRVKFGVYYIDLENNSGAESKGALVYHPTLRAVTGNSPAAAAGIKAGDNILALNNTIITSAKSLTSIIQDYRIGDEVIVKLLRDGKQLELEVKL